MNNLDKYYRLIDENKEAFEEYYRELVEYNNKVNLTAIVERNDVYTKHFLDSILAVDEIPDDASLIDIGAGAGFPSLPLKIVRPDINLTMIDSLNKRINFLDLVTNKLNIKSNNIHSRAEDYAIKNREKYDVAVARAVASLNTLVEYLLPFVKVGGIVLAYKGSSADDEIINAKNAIKILGGKVEKILNFTLPNEAGERNIIVIRKVHSTPIKYPRGQNKPKTDPII